MRFGGLEAVGDLGWWGVAALFVLGALMAASRRYVRGRGKPALPRDERRAAKRAARVRRPRRRGP